MKEWISSSIGQLRLLQDKIPPRQESNTTSSTLPTSRLDKDAQSTGPMVGSVWKSSHQSYLSASKKEWAVLHLAFQSYRDWSGPRQREKQPCNNFTFCSSSDSSISTTGSQPPKWEKEQLDARKEWLNKNLMSA